MANVLVLRKADKTIHIVPVDQEAFYKAQNNRLPVNDRMGLEIMDEEDNVEDMQTLAKSISKAKNKQTQEN